jgi:hypothetical protein
VALAPAPDEDLVAEVARDLDGDVGRAAEAEEPEPLAGADARAPIGAVPDDPRAQQRRERLRVQALGQRVGEVRRGDRVLA